MTKTARRECSRYPREELFKLVSQLGALTLLKKALHSSAERLVKIDPVKVAQLVYHNAEMCLDETREVVSEKYRKGQECKEWTEMKNVSVYEVGIIG